MYLWIRQGIFLQIIREFLSLQFSSVFNICCLIKIFTSLRQNIFCSYSKCSLHQLLHGWPNQEEWDGRRMWHVRWRLNVHKGFCLWTLWKREHLKDLGVDWRTIMNDLKEIVWDSVECTGLAQDEYKWQAVVIAVMDMCVS